MAEKYVYQAADWKDQSGERWEEAALSRRFVPDMLPG
jgi:hypothetical protein